MWSTFTSPPHSSLLDLNITRVECYPDKILVRFWGRYNNICELDYHILHNEVQNAAKTSTNIAVDDFCFAEDLYNGGWHRGRVIRKDEESYEVFLIDVGMVLTVDSRHIAAATKNLFQLPPKVVCGIFANIVPVRGIWSTTAAKYFSSLTTSRIRGYVEALLKYQIILVEVPDINQKLFELGLAKIIDGNTFNFLMEISKDLLGLPGYEITEPLYMQKCCRKPVFDETIILSPSFQRILDVLSPSLQTGVTETVKITCALGLHNFYCQLKRLAPELEAMARDMQCYYETEGKELNDGPVDNFGALCAVKGKDGRWYRGVVKQLLTSGQVEVWFMDYGRTEIVFPNYIKKLMPAFFMMPLISFPCALTGLSNQTKQWISLQTDILKESLFEETLTICIDSYSSKDHLYYVTLYKIKDISIHQVNGIMSEINPEIECSPKKKETRDSNGQIRKLRETKWKGTGKETCKPIQHSVRSNEMKINSSYVGFVEYVINPSDFWIRTSEYNDEFECLMINIQNHYSKIGINEGRIQKPVPGLFCCARYSKDLHFYRAVIKEVLDDQLRVFFVDFGNAEVVDFGAVKLLPPEYTNLPTLALNCSIAHVFPIEEVWTKDATNFFKKAVFNKKLFIDVVSRQGSRYVVEIKDMECREQSSISTMMLEAGYADFWNVQPNVMLFEQKCQWKFPKSRTAKSTTSEKRIYTDKNWKLKSSCSVPFSNTSVSTTLSPAIAMHNSFPRVHLHLPSWIKESKIASPYRQQVFKLGSVLDVRVSHINSPAEFWCQLQNNSNQLKLLMRNMQHYYSIPRDTFQFEHTGCVVKHAKDGQWYRASVIQSNFRKEEVTILFVDYGIQQKISIKNLFAINQEFLHLEGQAFRCTLNNIVQPVSHDPPVWDHASCNKFKQFIDNCLISGDSLKCTIFAMALMDGKGLCNVVDLHTPFINVCQLLLDMGLTTCIESPSSFNPSIQLYTPYYSAHDIKVGSEEKVYVTHVSSLSKFYCQLDKNTVVMDTLKTEVDTVSEKMQGQRLDLDKTSMCLAKYFEDGQWYRAIARSVQSPEHFKVFFIDYGNTEVVDKNDVAPIPEDAKGLILIPMQAVKCRLSLCRQKLSDETLVWFKQAVMGKPLTAFVVAKKSDGQLILELYDGSLKISAQITGQCIPYQYGREIMCLDETKWQSGNSLHPAKIVPSTEQLIRKQPDCLVHLIKETNRLIRSFLNTDQHYVGHKNKEQNCNLRKENARCMVGKRFKNKRNCQNEIIPKFTAHLARLKKTCNRKNLGETDQTVKAAIRQGKIKKAAHDVITSRKTLPFTKLCRLVQNSPAAQNRMMMLQWPKLQKDSIVEQIIVCQQNAFEKVKHLLTKYIIYPVILLTDQEVIKLLRKLDSRFVEVEINQDAVSLTETFPVMVHKNDLIRASKNYSPGFDGLMKEISFAEMENKMANKQCLVSPENLLPVDKSVLCSSLNPILCSCIQTRIEYTGFATSVIDPSEFYIQLADTFEAMETLSLLLAELSEDYHPLPQDILKPGVTCLIKSATDEQWSRVEIYEVSQQFVIVRAVDYGHYIFVPSSDLSRLRELPTELAEVPRLTNPCSLSNVVPSVGHNWTDEAIIFFQNSLNEQTLTIFFKQCISVLLWEVDLVINNKNVAEDLVSAGHAAFLKGIENSSIKDTISSAENIQVPTEPVLEQQFHKNELAVILLNEDTFEKFESTYSTECMNTTF
ncbi:tudor domain-containing protein 15-like [Rhincodon typus]|uniref:tudor domain-containing protein 15-like n=1 Tax=Rhincodon typus TaxID=259920 RepID=UPI00202E22EF|nr:tudor domain-containing protein 15-like [Rhincodon typus]